MKVLVIGQGGREHALIKAFYSSSSISEIHVAPGNDGMKTLATVHFIQANEFEKILSLCLKFKIDFVFIGPEDPLVLGLTDFLRTNGIPSIGPEKTAAQLEGSKFFAKKFMTEARVPTAEYRLVASVQETLLAAESFTPPYVLKADGLASGKGVFICKDLSELKQAAINLFEKKALGDAGKEAILEQSLRGWELSLLVLTNGSEHELLPISQDHKRLLDGDLGPNTGGMGAVAPISLNHELLANIEKNIIQPTIKNLNHRKYIYRGIIFIGVMVTPDGPFVLEYNVRLGDPESQVVLPLIKNDVGILFSNLANGILNKVEYRKLAACCLIMAAEGYPDNPIRGSIINGDINIGIGGSSSGDVDIDDEVDNGLNSDGFNRDGFSALKKSCSYFLHAGTKEMENGQWVTNGGRVLCSIGIAPQLSEAIKAAYLLSEAVNWYGIQKRSDIGKSLSS